MRRRDFIRLAAVSFLPPALALAAGRPALAQGVDVDAILRDPDAPTAGNPQGDVTIVAFLDYNCPFCKKSAPDLARIVAEDGHIRLVYKDWPILTEASVYGAKLALAAKFQEKYELVHAALMGIPGRKIPQEQMLQAVKASGVDMGRLEMDAQLHGAEIVALLKRTNAQAESLGLQGTPAYLVGPLLASTLDYASFKRAVAEARRRQAAEQ
ncbi:MAG: disulfide bond formation protein DsbA [Xanthobacter sp. 17-67-6]|jgi:protein-disulfide isomerase|nr:MAG: disulfide bond formation protein DsbA [Rhizobiales bacterium 24-66-13]OYZ86511.1 MAG: disulfide bond formation protein DsbA [Xanthobacter sp. 17-67-6]OZB06133.1 MAG: disulfide bond formation protein DsbA [Rhizobiales bacterium 39-66-18]HQS10598.1 DsbA family protein [Xanthobacteraceae bacterium]HQS49043.1 DsbA family protein [Xanthobacteraceae bacterium]